MKYKLFAVDRLQDILRLAITMHGETDFKTVPFDVEQTANSVLNMVINNPRGHGVLAYTDDDQVAGMLCGGISNYVFSRGSVANDYAFYVLPEHRGSWAAPRMIKMFSNWARENGATELYIGISSGLFADRTGKLLERSGFDHVGGNYRKHLNA